MDQDHEYWINWIIGDYTPFQYNQCMYFISTPPREDRFAAENIFLETYRESLLSGNLSDEDLNKLLNKYQLWDDSQEEQLQKLYKDVDDIKVKMFDSYTKSSLVAQIRIMLKDTEKQIAKMNEKKSTFNQLSARFIAHFAKQHYLMGRSIFQRKAKHYYKKRNWWTDSDESIINYAYKTIQHYNLDEHDYRELARGGAWRNLWNAKRAGGSIFGKPVADLSIYQKQLVMWSSMYDNVYKSSECPSDQVINDDDLLDGWFIQQKRKSDASINQNRIESSLGRKVAASEEIFILCDEDDIDKVYNCNDIEGKIRWNNRMKQLREQKIVSEMDFKDRKAQVQQRLSGG